MPRIHPIIQTISVEWQNAGLENHSPRWDMFTEENIEEFCTRVNVENPFWHEDLYVVDLNYYMARTPESRCWWFPA